MKKISKIFLYPLPIVAVMPTIAFATSCNNVDYDKALKWYEEELDKAQAAFEATSHDPNLEKGLNNIAEIERLFIKNKVPFYWLRTVINFRQDKYNEAHGVPERLCEAWDIYFGSSGEERKLYEEYKNEHINDWLSIEGNDAIITSCSQNVGFYQVLTVLNSFVAEKGPNLHEMAGWASHVIDDANNKLIEVKTDIYPLHAFYGDVDGANVGYIYSKMNTPFKSPTLALYKYYTELKSNQDRLLFYRTNVLKLDPKWTIDDDELFDALYNKMLNNFYIYQYAEQFTDIKLAKEDHKLYIAWALNNFIKRIWGLEK